MMREDRTIVNPFPGLRPFEMQGNRVLELVKKEEGGVWTSS